MSEQILEWFGGPAAFVKYHEMQSPEYFFDEGLS